MLTKRLYGSTCALALITGMLASPAWAQDATGSAGAQDAAQPAKSQATSTGLAEIVVTATRRATDLQSTPVSVSAVDSSLIQQASPRDLGDLAAFVPNFSAATIANFNAASFAMRGVGQTSIIVYFEPPVAVLVDDFVVPSVQTQLLDTFDVAQVEVLRGPQGTLFGKNTTGGVVTVRTKKPIIDYVGVEGRMEFGDFGEKKIQAAMNVPISDFAAVRLVGGYEKSDGYYKNGACYGPVTGFVTNKFEGSTGCLDNATLGGKDVWQARAKLLVEPTPELSALFQYEWIRDRSEVVPSVNENYLYTGSNAFLTDLLGLTDPNAQGTDPLDRAAYTGRNDALLYMGKGQRISVDGIYANIEYNADFGTFTSVSGYRFQRSRIPNSYAGATAEGSDGQLLSFFDATRDDDRKTWQQELRFASDFQGPFNFVAGGFYQRDKIDFCVSQILGFLDLTSGPLPFGEWNNTPYLLCNAQKAKSRALFFEGTFKFNDKLTLSAGARYTWDDKTWYGRQQTFIPALGGGFDPTLTIEHALDASVYNYPAGVVTVSDKWREPTYRASLSYQATDDLFVYGTYSHGYKGGGFNDQIGGFAAFGEDLDAFRAAARATDPEKADSYELGFKSQFLDNRLRFNATAFYVKYQDLQKQLNVPIEVNGQPNQVTLFVNAASATVKGLEVEAQANPVEGLTLRGVLGYQDGKYNSYTADNAGYDLSSAPLDRAPKWQWTLDGTYSVPLGDAYKITFNGNVAYSGRNLNTQAIDDPLGNTFLNSRTLVNASITLAQADDKYYIRAVGKNLTDKRYRVAVQNVAGLWLNSQYGAPRYFGVELGVKFGQYQ
ncbi:MULTISPECIES: TonB-dependent receptor [unclassified Novosphingobium]|uniref:TonB-dependent receptor n=1 Tax=unclassified Novosphingobium TaxID=2644732 RepID=UPI00020EFC59|nr:MULTISPECIES: TonB-dependent receptor [unclassified Novosphingobium]BBA74074.1 TonB-dependent receptor [Novosphingobium sp. PY1]GFM31311.1 TonB-dependent receptor [Novosphingobium sp. PY1]CCA90442.1 TonB-dependent receptor [Novosphingobium sp. PP1Y]